VNYRGHARVVYGHIVNPHPEWVNNTINIDTGCVFGGCLSALRYPELELVSVPARRAYVEGRVNFVALHPGDLDFVWRGQYVYVAKALGCQVPERYF
jgi:hypothetical protein